MCRVRLSHVGSVWLLLLSSACCAALDEPPPEIVAAARRLLTKEGSQTVVAAIRAERERAISVVKTALYLHGPIRYPSKEALTEALLLAGELRAPELVEDLYNDISFCLIGGNFTETEHRYVAVEALVAIGLPAVPRAIEELATKPREGYSFLFEKVLAGVLGDHVQEYVLREAARYEAEGKKECAERLRKTLPYIETQLAWYKRQKEAGMQQRDNNAKTQNKAKDATDRSKGVKAGADNKAAPGKAETDF